MKVTPTEGALPQPGASGRFLAVSLLVALTWLAGGTRVSGIGQDRFISTEPQPAGFTLFAHRIVAPIWVDTNDFPGVIRAAGDLVSDLGRVTGCKGAVVHAESEAGSNVVVIGTIGRSRVIDRLIGEGRINADRIVGKWESCVVQVVPRPWPGVANALVIAGSDKRGTIYGIYDVSEQIGVSPWYWWADVPVVRQYALYVAPGPVVQGPPAVKYRGIFLNDESPSLTGWVRKNYGNYNHHFYERVFELLLRLKANYLWPAMWDNCFNDDDPENPRLADEYGIVMGTSHVEPMMRADKEWGRKSYKASDWNYLTHEDALRAFWKEGLERNRAWENIITIGMRGKIDTPMSESANIALLEKIVSDQRAIIEDVMHTNAAAVPQVWALYKEVQEYYEKGMRVPDDVTLLWCDDNWGNVRRLPAPGERKRVGGAGVYYHFDYVGSPRNYKWLNTIPITKVWEQMHLAYEYDARQIWIVNVGDLKPMEFPMEFFLAYAWDPSRWPKERIGEFGRLWAEREFGPAHAGEIANLVATYTKYNGRRKPELLSPDTFSLAHYREADTVAADWADLVRRAQQVAMELPPQYRDAFFELVYYPVTACAVVNELYLTVARNRLCASQGLAEANKLADRARVLFRKDAELSDYYNHTLAGGKWDHMMDQAHIGYTSWQQPPSNIMPAVVEIRLSTNAVMAVSVEGSDETWPGTIRTPALPPFDPFNRQDRFIRIFNRGTAPLWFTVSADVPWIKVSATRGVVSASGDVWVSVDWKKAPRNSEIAFVNVAGPGGTLVPVKVQLFQPAKLRPERLNGFVELEGCVSIEAEHYTARIDAPQARWEKIDDYGRTLSSMTVFPVTAPSVVPPTKSPCLEYRMYLFSTGRVEVTSIIAPTLNFVPGRGLRFGISFDDERPQMMTAVPAGYFVDNGNRDWEESVRDSCRQIRSTHTVREAGYHTLKFWMVDPTVVLQKLVVNTGGVQASYLGPPESPYRIVRVPGIR